MNAGVKEHPPVRFVVASRESGDRFFEHTALGRCLRNFNVEIRLFEKNTKGLAFRYNQAIQEAREKPAILVFIHDDICLPGFFFIDEIGRALESFGVVGIVGNKRRVPRQPSWYYPDTNWTPAERQYLSGVLGYGPGPEKFAINDFGAPRQQVQLLDGLLLAVHSNTLISNQIEFDERFDFHFYDMDFCRQAEAKNITMGTWDISVIHGSLGGLAGENWKAEYQKYLDKWGD